MHCFYSDGGCVIRASCKTLTERVRHSIQGRRSDKGWKKYVHQAPPAQAHYTLTNSSKTFQLRHRLLLGALLCHWRALFCAVYTCLNKRKTITSIDPAWTKKARNRCPCWRHAIPAAPFETRQRAKCRFWGPTTENKRKKTCAQTIASRARLLQVGNALKII